MLRNLFTVLAVLFLTGTTFAQSSFLKSDFTKSTNRSPQSSALIDIHFTSDKIAPDLFKQSYSHLSDKAYKAKLKSALKDEPLLFMRSYVNTYYADLSAHAQSNNLILCMGDLHPENFGFIRFAEGYRFVFNDIDDSGVCPWEFDILRYFATLQLAIENKDLISELIAAYADVLHSKTPAPALPKELISKNLQKKYAKNLKKFTSKSGFKKNKKASALSDTHKKDLMAELQKSDFFKDFEIVDINSVTKESGGSGGLQRYWVYVRTQDSKSTELLELKELSRPGTSYGSWQQPPWSPTERLEKVAHQIWAEAPIHFGSVIIKETPFMVRTRDKGSIDLEDLKSEKQLKEYLMAQVGIIANYHKNFIVSEVPQLKDWISEKSLIISQRYQRTYEAFK